MPQYDYDCTACGRRIEVVHGVHAPGPTHCPNCGGGPLRKAITAAAVHFKGSGWAKKERRATVAPGASKSTSEAGSADGAKETAETSSTPKTDGGTDGGADGGAERTAATAKTGGSGGSGGSGTATKTE